MRLAPFSEDERLQVGEQSATNRKNLLLVINLRWLAIAGQIVTIAIVRLVLDIRLPLIEMAIVIGLFGAFNLVNVVRLRRGWAAMSNELFVQLLVDIVGLTALLYLSGGVTNPFISLYLIQVIIGAVLLSARAAWILVATSSLCFLLLTWKFRPMEMNGLGISMFSLHLQGMYLCFLLAAGLLVVMVTRINRNLAERDANLEAMRRRSAEEDHIVRLGLLASGAAHELGTPLSTLSVIVADWGKIPQISGDPDHRDELREMREEIARCKRIVSRILLLSGQARGEGAAPTSLTRFLDDAIMEWRARRSPADFAFDCRIKSDPLIASDIVFKQMLHNVLDNALEASPSWVRAEAEDDGDELSIQVHDRGPGFSEDMLEDFAKPYRSTKGSPGGGLGLFLVVNVARKLGGEAAAHNKETGGATISLRLPLASLAVA